MCIVLPDLFSVIVQSDALTVARWISGFVPGLTVRSDGSFLQLVEGWLKALRSWPESGSSATSRFRDLELQLAECQFCAGPNIVLDVHLMSLGPLHDRETLVPAAADSDPLRLTVQSLTPARCELRINASELRRAFHPWVVGFLLEMGDRWPEIQNRLAGLGIALSTQEPSDQERQPTLRTRERARAFRELKEAHPGWSQTRVAMEAQKELREAVNADTVRNTYRAMGWKWERADRIR